MRSMILERRSRVSDSSFPVLSSNANFTLFSSVCSIASAHLDESGSDGSLEGVGYRGEGKLVPDSSLEICAQSLISS